MRHPLAVIGALVLFSGATTCSDEPDADPVAAVCASFVVAEAGTPADQLPEGLTISGAVQEPWTLTKANGDTFLQMDGELGVACGDLYHQPATGFDDVEVTVTYRNITALAVVADAGCEAVPTAALPAGSCEG